MQYDTETFFKEVEKYTDKPLEISNLAAEVI